MMYGNCSGYSWAETWWFPSCMPQRSRTESAGEQRLPHRHTGRLGRAGSCAGARVALKTHTPTMGSAGLCVTKAFQEHEFTSCLMTGCFFQLPLCVMLFNSPVHLPRISDTLPCNGEALPNGLLAAQVCCRLWRRWCIPAWWEYCAINLSAAVYLHRVFLYKMSFGSSAPVKFVGRGNHIESTSTC